MRWERLFEDLEARAAASERAELAAEIDERVIAERAAVALGERLAAHRGRELGVVLVGGSRVRGVLRSVAADGFLMVADGAELLVPAHAVAVFEGLERRTAVRTAVEARLRVTSVLRRLAEQRSPVMVETAAGTVSGVLVEVGADHVDIDAAEGRRATVATAAVRLVRSAGEGAF